MGVSVLFGTSGAECCIADYGSAEKVTYFNILIALFGMTRAHLKTLFMSAGSNIINFSGGVHHPTERIAVHK